MTQPLFLIGPRGCGKTTVGMALADSLNRRFVDTDQWLQSQLNMTVAEIVEREEWAGFRARETAALEAVTAPSTVIATGGGIILTEFNRHFMQNNGIVVYLCAPVSVLVNRLQAAPEEDLRLTLTNLASSRIDPECVLPLFFWPRGSHLFLPDITQHIATRNIQRL